MEELKELKEVKKGIEKDFLVNGVGINNIKEEEPKKRGRKSYSEMSEEEKTEYDKKKKEKEEEKAEIKRLEELGVKAITNKDVENSVEIILPEEFIKKCKKEKINAEQYSDIIFLLIDAFVKEKIKINGKATVKYSLED